MEDFIMVPALLVMCGLGAVLGIVLSLASKIFYVYEDPRIAQVEDCLAGANCGGCGYAGCSAAAVAVVEGKAPANVCIVAGDEATQASRPSWEWPGVLQKHPPAQTPAPVEIVQTSGIFTRGSPHAGLR
jgi:hypothetical protein